MPVSFLVTIFQNSCFIVILFILRLIKNKLLCFVNIVPGGTLSLEGEYVKTDVCIFNTPDEINLEIMKSWEQVFIKLMRRYKYLEKIFQVNILSILWIFQSKNVYLEAFINCL